MIYMALGKLNGRYLLAEYDLKKIADGDLKIQHRKLDEQEMMEFVSKGMVVNYTLYGDTLVYTQGLDQRMNTYTKSRAFILGEIQDSKNTYYAIHIACNCTYWGESCKIRVYTEDRLIEICKRKPKFFFNFKVINDNGKETISSIKGNFPEIKVENYKYDYKFEGK